MEKVPLNNVQLDHLATADAILKPYFYGTVACDRLPSHPVKKEPRGYIVNTDPHYRVADTGWHFGPIVVMYAR